MAPATSHPFLKVAIAAFPPSCRTLAESAATALVPFMDNDYRQPFIEAAVLGKTVRIPKRIHLLGLDVCDLESRPNFGLAAQCLCTRSTNGHLRQTSLRRILGIHEFWTIPFVFLLAGEYVVEITEDLVASLPVLHHGAYINFVRENRPTMRRLRSQAESY